MKKNSRIAITVSLIAFCLNSCTWIKTKHVLTTAETLMADCPDSALSILIDIDSSVLRTRPMQAKHALLLSMALDKNYIDIADDSIISIAYNYYQNHPTKREKMLYFYYSGVVKQNAGNTIRAAIDFNQALSLAKELNDKIMPIGAKMYEAAKDDKKDEKSDDKKSNDDAVEGEVVDK